jgi:hypothetical protein
MMLKLRYPSKIRKAIVSHDSVESMGVWEREVIKERLG